LSGNIVYELQILLQQFRIGHQILLLEKMEGIR